MNNLKIILLLSMGMLYFSKAVAQNLNIIPKPNQIVVKAGSYALSSKAVVVFSGFKSKPHNLDVFAKQLISQVKPDATTATTQKLNIKLDASKITGNEAYQLSINTNGINITAGNEKGAFYALQTLAQLIINTNTNALPVVDIVDQPRYKYRGLLLDVGRHFFTMDFLKAYIDMMATYKLNTFHWHLTEDQGWRIEIKKYPKLTSIASGREGTLLNHLHDKERQYDMTPYKGYYSQEEVKEIVRYAASKYITVIPEIDIPGHTLAALSAYPDLGCGENPGPYKAAMRWGIFEDILCAGKEDTFKFVEGVFDEVLALFPSTYIHIGGDEAPKTRWKACKFCQQRIKDHNLKDEHELQSYFVKRIEKYLNNKGRKLVGWDEILDGGLAPNATVMGWRGVKPGIKAAKLGHDVIMVPSSHLYLDHRESTSLEEPLTISKGNRHSSLKNVYDFNPSIDTLAVEFQKNIIGVQANLWTEYISTAEKAWYLALPRILGLSEIAWTELKNKNWDEFSKVTVPAHLKGFDRKGTTYRVPEVYGIENKTYQGENFEFELHPSVKGAKIYYNLSGRPVSELDRLYTSKFKVNVPKGENRTLSVIVVTPSGKRSVTTTAILNNKEAVKKEVNSVK